MKHIIESDPYIFHTSKSNYFELHDYERSIWGFYQNNKKTAFHVQGTPEDEFSAVNLVILDAFSCCLASLKIQLLDACNFRCMVLDISKDIQFQNNLSNLSKQYSLFIDVLNSYSAQVSDEKIRQYIKENELW